MKKDLGETGMTDRMEPYVLTHALVTDGTDIFIRDGAIIVEEGLIREIGKSEDLVDKVSRIYDLGGRILLPGLLNPHHHLYSSFATGLSPMGRTDTFLGLLQNLWWHLDTLLDEESLYFSALAGAMEAVRYGVTAIFDHHASMNFVTGSLDLVAEALCKTGIKGVLCFETSDRMGDLQVHDHIRENISFWEKHRGSETIRGAFGLHANLTLSEDTLEEISRIKPPEIPVHAHCGESSEDLDYCISLGYEGPVDRFHRWGLVDERSLLIHAIHLSSEDYRLIDTLDPYVVTNPESNANNRVGSMRRDRIRSFLLGTDGMSSDMVQSLRSMYLLGRVNQESFTVLRDTFFRNSRKALKAFFPSTGELKQGFRADLAVLDYIPLTPISMENLIGHLIFGSGGGKMWMTISDGKILWHNGRFLSMNEDALLPELKRVSEALHRRFYGSKPLAHL